MTNLPYIYIRRFPPLPLPPLKLANRPINANTPCDSISAVPYLSQIMSWRTLPYPYIFRGSIDSISYFEFPDG